MCGEREANTQMYRELGQGEKVKTCDPACENHQKEIQELMLLCETVVVVVDGTGANITLEFFRRLAAVRRTLVFRRES